jgi:hypothetical protein
MPQMLKRYVIPRVYIQKSPILDDIDSWHTVFDGSISQSGRGVQEGTLVNSGRAQAIILGAKSVPPSRT